MTSVTGVHGQGAEVSRAGLEPVVQLERVRTRDPDRRERILDAATELFVERGYHAVNISDIGGAAGIVGTGIYRHFRSKVAILVEMCERVVDRLLADAEVTLKDLGDPLAVLHALVDRQVEFTIKERALYLAYVLESRNLPVEDERRLRWKQRHYIQLWNEMLSAARPELDRAEARVLVGAAISAIHSRLRFSPSTLPDERLAEVLSGAAHRALGIDVLLNARAANDREAGSDGCS